MWAAGWGDHSYLQVLPPDVDGRKGQLHLLPAGVFMAFVGDFDKDEEDPCCYASSHQHEDPCYKRTGQTDTHKKKVGDVSYNPPQLCRFHREWMNLRFKSAPTMAVNHTNLQTTTGQSHSTRNYTAQCTSVDIKAFFFNKGIGQKSATVPYHCSFCPITFKRTLSATRTIPAMFSKVSVAGALLLESHSWYLTQVLSRSSMNPFSWELQGIGGGGEKCYKVNKKRKRWKSWAVHPRDYNRDGIGTAGQVTDGHKRDTDKQIARKGRREDIDRDMTPGNVLDGC